MIRDGLIDVFGRWIIFSKICGVAPADLCGREGKRMQSLLLMDGGAYLYFEQEPSKLVKEINKQVDRHIKGASR